MVIENANTDLEMRRHNWRVNGEKGKCPGYVTHQEMHVNVASLSLVNLIKYGT